MVASCVLWGSPVICRPTSKAVSETEHCAVSIFHWIYSVWQQLRGCHGNIGTERLPWKHRYSTDSLNSQSPKVCRQKIIFKFFEIMGFVKTFRKTMMKMSILAKISILMQSGSEIIGTVVLQWLHTNLSNFLHKFSFHNVINLGLLYGTTILTGTCPQLNRW